MGIIGDVDLDRHPRARADPFGEIGGLTGTHVDGGAGFLRHRLVRVGIAVRFALGRGLVFFPGRGAVARQPARLLGELGERVGEAVLAVVVGGIRRLGAAFVAVGGSRLGLVFGGGGKRADHGDGLFLGRVGVVLGGRGLGRFLLASAPTLVGVGRVGCVGFAGKARLVAQVFNLGGGDRCGGRGSFTVRVGGGGAGVVVRIRRARSGGRGVVLGGGAAIVPGRRGGRRGFGARCDGVRPLEGNGVGGRLDAADVERNIERKNLAARAAQHLFRLGGPA
ncbi:MAG: hypothetical protein FJX37_00365 [Alphaproteobacteria bacterium]|nr:hypothetical protein [Alphaproteobacteria bacterium]